jgi:hypothetical protein
MSPPAEPALDPTEILLGLNNGPGIYVAPANTPPPADLATDWASPWLPLGYLSDDGVTVGASTTSDTLTPWQSTSPVRTMITVKELTMKFVMWQTGPLQMALYFDMKAPTPDVDGGFSFDVRSDEGGNLYALGLDIADQDVITRITFGRAQLSDTGDVAFQRGAAVGWDVTLAALDNNGVLATSTRARPGRPAASGRRGAGGLMPFDSRRPPRPP